MPDPAALPELEPEPEVLLPDAPPPEPETEPEDEPLPEPEPDMLPDEPRSRSETEPLPEPEAEPDALQPARAITASTSVVANNFFPSIPLHLPSASLSLVRKASFNSGKSRLCINKRCA